MNEACGKRRLHSSPFSRNDSTKVKRSRRKSESVH